MQATLSYLRENYFLKLAQDASKKKLQCIILTHLLEDRPELLKAFGKIAPISLIIAIPYSIHHPTFSHLKNIYAIETPELEKLHDPTYLIPLVIQHTKKDIPVIIIEIGGYFAAIANTLQKKLAGNLVGIIEDTEAGHRRYEAIADKLPCPVISVARSKLKKAEDFLVGSSCLYSTEKILRQNGFPIEGKSALTLGFGKVGRGVAHSLLKHHCSTAVYDTDPIKRIIALSEGFRIPDKETSICNADIIFGATGNHSITQKEFKLIRNGALLISCSSRNIEFETTFLKKNYHFTKVGNYLSRYENEKQFFYLAADGYPINFIDGAVIGPALSLVQSELLLAITRLLELKGKKGLFEIKLEDKKNLANIWLQCFCDKDFGHYKLDNKNESRINFSAKKRNAHLKIYYEK